MPSSVPKSVSMRSNSIMSVAEVDKLTSLLEQCLLYNSSKYMPFSGNASVIGTLCTEDAIAAPKDNDNQGVGVEPVSSEVRPFFSIDLDFGTPLSSGQSLVKPITPFARSTNRRRWQGRANVKCQRTISHYAPRIHRKIKSKKPIKPLSTSPAHAIVSIQDGTLKFLSLPAEIREMIYMSLFENSRLYISQKPSCRHSFDLHLAIRSVCKQIREESLACLIKCLTVTWYSSTEWNEPFKSLKQLLSGPVLERLESIVIVCSFWSRPIDHIPFADFPSFHKISVLEIGTEWLFEYANMDAAIREATTRSKSMIEKYEQQRDPLNHASRSVEVQYEIEVRNSSTEDRAAYMGTLKREHCQFMTISCHSSDPQNTLATKLTINQFEKRCEMYQWMESDPVRLRTFGHGIAALRFLEKMRYHDSLDQIEMGIAKSLRKAESVKGDEATK